MKTRSPVKFLEDLGRLALFADLPGAELEAIVRSRDEKSSGEGTKVQAFLVSHPPVMYRMPRVEARRSKTASAWRT